MAGDKSASNDEKKVSRQKACDECKAKKKRCTHYLGAEVAAPAVPSAFKSAPALNAGRRTAAAGIVVASSPADHMAAAAINNERRNSLDVEIDAVLRAIEAGEYERREDNFSEASTLSEEPEDIPWDPAQSRKRGRSTLSEEPEDIAAGLTLALKRKRGRPCKPIVAPKPRGLPNVPEDALEAASAMAIHKVFAQELQEKLGEFDMQVQASVQAHKSTMNAANSVRRTVDNWLETWVKGLAK
ncbi:hypothetical protein N7474_001086 [Penicillium riverlandense]|uniref:uncharacterized protein n=1 Tax=Penicillium riverlandense TaxID=1903569 RepID=UPI002547802E|nr:uncharacterized protein N7474_001086 [Penicillium riverlandense]KAJ5832775.1 hypothetical protein N7474_001086 [Penicillium riverlandense]